MISRSVQKSFNYLLLFFDPKIMQDNKGKFLLQEQRAKHFHRFNASQSVWIQVIIAN